MRRQAPSFANARCHPGGIALAAAFALAAAAPQAAQAATSCRDDDLVGRCEGSRVVWCEHGVEHVVDCADLDLACGWDERAQWWTCVESERRGGCPGGITWKGLCASDQLLVWCQDGEVRSMLCTGGTACAWDPDQGFFDCVTVDEVGSRREAAPAPTGPPDDAATAGDAARAAGAEDAAPRPLTETEGDWARATADGDPSRAPPVPTEPIGRRHPGDAGGPGPGDAAVDAGASASGPSNEGCAAGSSPQAWGGALAALALWAALRRRRAATHR